MNLSLSEGKQWSDLRTICPCHLYLHLVQFFAPSLPRRVLLLPHRESSKEPGLRRRGIAASHLSRGPEPAERKIEREGREERENLPICKRVADGHHHRSPARPLFPGIYMYIDAISQLRYLACWLHFFGPPPRTPDATPR